MPTKYDRPIKQMNKRQFNQSKRSNNCTSFLNGKTVYGKKIPMSKRFQWKKCITQSFWNCHKQKSTIIKCSDKMTEKRTNYKYL